MIKIAPTSPIPSEPVIFGVESSRARFNRGFEPFTPIEKELFANEPTVELRIPFQQGHTHLLRVKATDESGNTSPFGHLLVSAPLNNSNRALKHKGDWDVPPNKKAFGRDLSKPSGKGDSIVVKNVFAQNVGVMVRTHPDGGKARLRALEPGTSNVLKSKIVDNVSPTPRNRVYLNFNIFDEPDPFDLEIKVLKPGFFVDGVAFLNSSGPLTTVPAGEAPQHFTVGDFDGDGDLDVAVAGADGIFPLLGQLGPAFVLVPGMPTSAPSGLGPPGAIAAGDVTGDGRPNVVTVHPDDDAIASWWGHQNAWGMSALMFPAASAPSAVVLADLDGDGKLDVATANSASNEVAVLVGNGNGTFGSPARFPAGTAPRDIAPGDLDGDGFVDLVTANSGSNDVSILLGNGDGTFEPAVHVPVGMSPSGTAIGDLDGDGFVDLVTANSGSNDVSILLGNGDGTFDPAVHFQVGPFPRSLALADLDGDGKDDLAVATSGDHSVRVFTDIVVPPLTITPKATDACRIPWFQSPIKVTLTDLNGDGHADLGVLDQGANDLSLFLNQALPSAVSLLGSPCPPVPVPSIPPP
ncbi:MAG: FG-GAP repeat domain-containing protein [Actinomycetota bacterium]